MMDRRRFLRTSLAGVVATPLAAEGQPSRKVRLGYLSGNPPSDTEDAIAAFRSKLRGLGYIEGQNLSIESRFAEGQYERLPQLAADLVRLSVDVILVYSTPGALAARNATKTIPIVFAGVSDPITVGLVDALTRPGGNITGVTLDNPALTGKRLSLLKEAAPTASRTAVLVNPDFQASAGMVAETTRAAKTLGLEIQVLEARQPQELPQAFNTMTVARIAALIVLPDPMFVSQRRRITELAATRRIASMYHLRQFVTAGGLLSYGADYTEAFEQSAVLVDKLLRGTRAADLPVEHPWRYSLVINLKTAKALGLTIPPSLLARADQIIE